MTYACKLWGNGSARATSPAFQRLIEVLKSEQEARVNLGQLGLLKRFMGVSVYANRSIVVIIMLRPGPQTPWLPLLHGVACPSLPGRP